MTGSIAPKPESSVEFVPDVPEIVFIPTDTETLKTRLGARGYNLTHGKAEGPAGAAVGEIMLRVVSREGTEEFAAYVEAVKAEGEKRQRALDEQQSESALPTETRATPLSTYGIGYARAMAGKAAALMGITTTPKGS